MKLKSIELASRWLEIAKEDFEMAQFSFEKAKLLYCSFHLQQSLEKTLKGLYVSFDMGQPPYIHDLARLADELTIDAKYMAFFSELNPFYIKARYPDYKRLVSQSLSKNLVQNYLLQGKEVIKWLEDRLLELSKSSSN